MDRNMPKIMSNMRWGLWAIVILGILAYAVTFQVPFYFDDSVFLADPAFTNHQGLMAVWHSDATRPFTYTTLYLNYLFGGSSPWGYHVVNLIFHLATAVLVLLLAHNLSATPNSGVASTASGDSYMPAAVIAAWLFVVHPLNTQAVTYIVQRAAVFCAFFYLLAMLAYLRARLGSPGAARAGWVVLCVVAGVFAILSKQTAATLPLSLLLIELMFFPISRKKMAALGGVLLAALLLAIALFASGKVSLATIDRATRETFGLTRFGYLADQTQVLWHYIRLFLAPIGLRLEYEPPSTNDWGAAPVILASLAHLTVLGTALFFARKKPIPAFGVLFFYVANLVESSILPIRDIIVEHRTYLPNVGLCIAVGWLFRALYLRYLNHRSAVVLTAASIVAVLLIMTVQRNLLWRNPVAFFEQNTALEPGNARALGELSTAYINKHNYTAAFDALRKVDRTKLNSTTSDKYLVNLVIALAGMGRNQDAIRVGRSVLDTNTIYDPKLRAVILNTLAVSYGALGLDEQAMRSLEEALQLDPNNAEIVKNYAIAKRAGLR